MAGGVGRSSARTVRNRRRRVAELVAERGPVSVEEIADETGVSSVTIYRDIGALEEAGLVNRSQRGLVSPAGTPPDSAKAGAQDHPAEKAAIAEAAVKLLQPGSTVFLDGSSTSVMAAQALPDAPLTVITHSLLVAAELKRKPQLRLLLTGGEYQATDECLVGRAALDMISALRADHCVIEAAGISRNECFHPDDAVAQVKQAMIASSNRPMLLVDHTKWRLTALHRFAALSDFAEVIVDPRTDTMYLDAITEAGSSVTMAEQPVCPHCERMAAGLGPDGGWRVVYDVPGHPRRELVPTKGIEMQMKGGQSCPHCDNIAHGFGMG